jgi:macrodomain Ter protein organizer (MatP/YcbG family)
VEKAVSENRGRPFTSTGKKRQRSVHLTDEAWEELGNIAAEIGVLSLSDVLERQLQDSRARRERERQSEHIKDRLKEKVDNAR